MSNTNQPTLDAFQGFIAMPTGLGSLRIDVEFQAPTEASKQEKDAAFLDALAQQIDVEYVCVGTLNATPPASNPQAKMRYWAVTGSLPDSGECRTFVFEAETQDQAQEQFEDALWNLVPERIRDKERERVIKACGQSIWIDSIQVSDTPIQTVS